MKEENLMFSKKSGRAKYLPVALLGLAAGGLIVALTTRAAPKIKSGIMAKCEQMMASLCEAPEQAACHPEGGSSCGSH